MKKYILASVALFLIAAMAFGTLFNWVQPTAALTTVDYDVIVVDPFAPNLPDTGATVNFKIINSDTEIAQFQTKPGWSGGTYSIDPPRYIETDAGSYFYMGASREELEGIDFKLDPELNETDLFYALPPTATKTAAYKGVTAPGTETDPVLVDIGEEFTYTISIDNPEFEVEQDETKYDMLFVLDWSGSMETQYSGGLSGNGTTATARIRAKDSILYMTQQVIANYPGSRVAVMGLNCSQNIMDDPRYLNLQVDSPFVGDQAGYESIINGAYAPPNDVMLDAQDDDAQFLHAAIDKMLGDDSYLYGTLAKVQRRVVPRDEPKHIPVIVLISDWQMTYTTPYWSSSLYREATRFANEFPDGILLTVRTDHQSNSGSNGPNYDAVMNNYVMAPGGMRPDGVTPRWGWVKFEGNQFQEVHNALLWNLVGDKAPYEQPLPAVTVTDLLPEGLEYVSSNPEAASATLVDGRWEVVWELDALPVGTTELKVTVRVNQFGRFVNEALIEAEPFDPIATSKTYHTTPFVLLHVRQVILNPKKNVLGIPENGYVQFNAQRKEEPTTTQPPIYMSGPLDGPAQLLPGTSGDAYDVIAPCYTADTMPVNPAERYRDFYIKNEKWRDEGYYVWAVVPMYYRLVRMEFGPTEATQMVSLNRILDIRTQKEWWITVYLEPVL